MSNEVKHRKKGGSPSAKEAKDVQRTSATVGQRAQEDAAGKVAAASPASGSGSPCPDVRTVLCCLCLAVCVALTWIVFQQSQNFTLLEEKYRSLQSRSSALGDLEAKVGDIFGKLVTTDDLLAEATASSSLVNQLEQQVSNLHNNIDSIQSKEQTLSKMMQNINTKFQNVTETWKNSLEEMNLETGSLKSEAKAFHQEMTSKINSADQTIKVLTERLKEFADSTPRNLRTVKRQEDEELQGITAVMEYDGKAIEQLEKEQDDLANINEEVQKNMRQLEPKLKECIANLPTVDDAVRSLVKVSREMLDFDKKINELTVQVFNTEDNLLKIISETLEIQHALEGIQLDNSILKMQNDLSALKDKMQTPSLTSDDSPPEVESND